MSTLLSRRSFSKFSCCLLRALSNPRENRVETAKTKKCLLLYSSKSTLCENHQFSRFSLGQLGPASVPVKTVKTANFHGFHQLYIVQYCNQDCLIIKITKSRRD